MLFYGIAAVRLSRERHWAGHVKELKYNLLVMPGT